jgi:ABC-type lipopolysaccharide export system ATPase subunit
LFPLFSEFEDTKLYQLSGGERRLIEVYVTLKSNSKIILLDEPFSYLSQIYNQILKKIILEEKEHKIIIITDHMYQNILEISDDVYLLKDGWGIQIKSHEELIRHNYVRSL